MFTFDAGARPGPASRSRPSPPLDDDVVEGTAHEVPPRREELP
jgi:hypothetical protein